MQAKSPGRIAKPPKTLAQCCTDVDCHAGRRNRYYFGKHLSPHSYEVEQQYQSERRRLINRAVIGWGVVYGYPLSLQPQASPGEEGRALRLGAGLALDACGRELLQVEPICLELKDVLAFDVDGKLLRTALPWADAKSKCWLLRVHYAERLIGPVRTKDNCGCEACQWDQICETVKYS